MLAGLYILILTIVVFLLVTEAVSDIHDGIEEHRQQTERDRYGKFKVGDKVVIDPNKVTLSELMDYGSSGTKGNRYIVMEVGSSNVRLEGSNWHQKRWITKISNKNVIGGNIL